MGQLGFTLADQREMTVEEMDLAWRAVDGMNERARREGR